MAKIILLTEDTIRTWKSITSMIYDRPKELVNEMLKVYFLYGDEGQELVDIMINSLDRFEDIPDGYVDQVREVFTKKLELRIAAKKASRFKFEMEETTELIAASKTTTELEVEEALTDLGYKPKELIGVVKKAIDRAVNKEDSTEVLHYALQTLNGG